jgi:WD40 repeat protein
MKEQSESGMSGPKVFLSYNRADRDWAEWMAAVLENAGYQSIIQAWHFRPGENFVLRMHEAARDSDFTIAVLSDNYLKADFTQPEWAAAFARDAGGKQRKLVPVRVSNCQPDGLLAQIIYLDLVGLDEVAAAKTLVGGLKSSGKPDGPVAFPGKQMPTPSCAPFPPSLGKLINVPELPPHFLPRTEDLETLKQHVLDAARKPVGVTGLPAAKTGVHGMGGIGKTVLAAALARDLEVRQEFPDGVIWVTLGLTPHITSLQRQIAQALGATPPLLENEQQGRSYLSGLLAERTVLIIFDDVWRDEHLTPFNVLGPPSQMLITTRDARIIHRFNAAEHRVDKLSEEQAFHLLSEWSKLDIFENHRLVGFDLVRECDCLPLAIAMIGARVRGSAEELYRQLNRLQKSSLNLIEQHYPEYQYPHLLRAIEVSVEMLVQDSIPELRERYLDFTAFPEDTSVPPAVLRTMWRARDATEDRTTDALERLVDLALLRREENGWFSLHDLQRDYLQNVTQNSVGQAHARLVDAYSVIAPNGRHTVKADGYYYEHLLWHLRQGGRTTELRALLFDLNWLTARLKATDLPGLVGDYALCPEDEEVRLVQQALSLSADAIGDDTGQLPGQLVGRLASFSNPCIRRLVDAARNWRSNAWLLPLNPNLNPPGSGLLRTLRGHTNRVTALAISADGRRAISGSADTTVRIWDLDSGRMLRTLRGHTAEISFLILTADGRRAISTSEDQTLRVWDLESGREVRLVPIGEGTSNIKAVVTDAYGRIAVVLSTPNQDRLDVWNLESGQKLHSLQPHGKYVTSVEISADGRWARSFASLKVREELLYNISEGCNYSEEFFTDAPAEEAVRLWDLKTGQTLPNVPEVVTVKKSQSETPDGRRGLSAEDSIIRLWDLECSRTAPTFKGSAEVISTVAFNRVGRRVITASLNGTICLWDSNTKREPKTIHLNGVRAFALSADCRRIIVGCGGRNNSDVGELSVWLLPRWSCIKSFIAGGGIKAVAISGNATIAVSTANGGRRRCWDLKRGAEIPEVEGGFYSMAAVALDDSSGWGLSGTLIIPKPHSEIPLAPGGGSGRGRAIALSADGGRAIFASDDRTLEVWNLATGVKLGDLAGHSQKITAVAFAPDARLAISGSCDATVKVWNLERGCCAYSFTGDSKILCCAIAPDGRLFAAGEESGRLHFLRLEGVD